MNRRAMVSSRFRLLFAPLALLAAGCSADSPASRPPLEGAAIGGEFTLIDKASRPVRYSDFAGRYRMVYFGYTFCPDVCPLDVQRMMQGYALFAKAEPDMAKQVQPIFITIDPQRDTPAVVGEFAAAFSQRLLGLTGTEQQVAAATKAFKVYRAKGADSPGGGYLMDHSNIVYLMDRDGQPLAMLPVDKGPQAVADELERWTD